MSIYLSEEDRASLQRLEERRIGPMRRQRAIALLRLSEGKSPTEAAKQAGIPKEEVEALAARFSESGLSGVGLVEHPRIAVRVGGPGIGLRKFRLPRGATVADLLRRSNITLKDRAVFIDDLLAGESAPLRDGAIVWIIPIIRNAAVDQPWLRTVPSFQDDSVFQEYMESLKAHRHDLGEDEAPEQ